MKSILQSLFLGIIIVIGNTLAYHYGGYDFWDTQGYRTREILITLYKTLFYFVPAIILYGPIQQRRKANYSLLRIIVCIVLAILLVSTKTISKFYGDISQATKDWNATYLYVIFFNSIIEEYVFRGLMLSSLQSRYSSYISISIQAIIFSLIHIPLYLILWGSGWMMIISLIQVGIFGRGLGYCKKHNQSLFYPIVLHSIWNGILLFL